MYIFVGLHAKYWIFCVLLEINSSSARSQIQVPGIAGSSPSTVRTVNDAVFVQALNKLQNQTILGHGDPARATLLYRVPQKSAWTVTLISLINVEPMITNFEKLHPPQNENPPSTLIDFLDFSTIHSLFIRVMY